MHTQAILQPESKIRDMVVPCNDVVMPVNAAIGDRTDLASAAVLVICKNVKGGKASR